MSFLLGERAKTIQIVYSRIECDEIMFLVGVITLH